MPEGHELKSLLAIVALALTACASDGATASGSDAGSSGSPATEGGANDGSGGSLAAEGGASDGGSPASGANTGNGGAPGAAGADNASGTSNSGAPGAAGADNGSNAGSCGTPTELVASINGVPFCFPMHGATMPKNPPQQTIAFGSTEDSLSRTLTVSFPGPDIGVFACNMVYREVSAMGHTGNSTSCTLKVTEVGTGSPTIIKGTFSAVLPYTDGPAPAGMYTITDGSFTIERNLN